MAGAEALPLGQKMNTIKEKYKLSAETFPPYWHENFENLRANIVVHEGNLHEKWGPH